MFSLRSLRPKVVFEILKFSILNVKFLCFRFQNCALFHSCFSFLNGVLIVSVFSLNKQMLFLKS